MSNEVVIILSHADTTDKLEILDKCVAEIKKQGYEIIISSHIELPKKYYSIVDYIAYDMDNPLIKYSDSGAPHVFIWHSNDACSQSFPLEYNHSYAVMKLIKTGLGIAYANGYEKAHFVNYDYVLNDPAILKTHTESVNVNDIYSYYYDTFDIERRHINTGLFSVKIKPFLEFSKKINSTTDFLNQNEPVFEKFVYIYYVEKCGLTIELANQESLFEGNIINSKTVLKNVIDDRISAYLAKESSTGEYFISLRIKDDVTEDILIDVKGTVFSFRPVPYDNANIIDITDIINEGTSIGISIPKYGFTDIYNLSTHHAVCNVFNRNIIIKLSEIPILEDSIKPNPASVIIAEHSISEVRSFREISDSVDCDKTVYHKYDKVYPDFLEGFRNEKFNMFEIGIEAGKSLKIWQEYFPNANIYGMDIGVSLKYDRGEVFLGDQSKNEDLIRISSNIGKCKFILDDGSHIADHQLKTFYYLFENLLEYGGVYIIEDIECSYWKPRFYMYGNETGHLNIVDYFTKLNHDVNSHYNLGENNLHIKSITFAPNCIIIKKKTEFDIIDDEREYRFSDCIKQKQYLC